MQALGYIASFFTAYNIICGMLLRLANKDNDARQAGIEAAIWFIAAVICFK